MNIILAVFISKITALGKQKTLMQSFENLSRNKKVTMVCNGCRYFVDFVTAFRNLLCKTKIS